MTDSVIKEDKTNDVPILLWLGTHFRTYDILSSYLQSLPYLILKLKPNLYVTFSTRLSAMNLFSPHIALQYVE